MEDCFGERRRRRNDVVLVATEYSTAVWRKARGGRGREGDIAWILVHAVDN